MSLYGELAQLGEHLPCTQGVKGSSPLFSTMNREVQADCTLKTEYIYFVYKQVNNENEIEKILSLIRVFLREQG